MSLIFEKLCKSILLEHFGSIVAEVGSEIFQHGSRTLGQIIYTTKLPVTKVISLIFNAYNYF